MTKVVYVARFQKKAGSKELFSNRFDAASIVLKFIQILCLYSGNLYDSTIAHHIVSKELIILWWSQIQAEGRTVDRTYLKIEWNILIGVWT